MRTPVFLGIKDLPRLVAGQQGDVQGMGCSGSVANFDMIDGIPILEMDKPRPVICWDGDGDIFFIIRPRHRAEDLATLFGRLETVKKRIHKR